VTHGPGFHFVVTCGILLAMDTHTNGTSNGKAQHHHDTIVVPAPELQPSAKPNSDIEHAFLLASQVIGLERQLNEKMSELSALFVNLDPTDMPKFLVAMMKQPGVSQTALVTLPLAKTRAIMLPPAPKDAEEPTMLQDYCSRITALMGDGKERKSKTIINCLKAKKHSSMAYLALKHLVETRVLVKPAFGWYRLRGAK